MYQALYRKWRPLTFADVSGQNHITETLKTQLETNRLSHAYLFTGTRGTGKTTCAKILSRAVNCQNLQNGDPCNACPACLGILEGSILDVIEIDAASNNGVDNIRDIRDEARYTPATVKKRVYIIDEVHMLSQGAFNALLKTLEEPPAHVLFVLATTEIHKVPATILSRCQRFDFRRIGPKDIIDRLQEVALGEGILISSEAASLMARLADGGMRDALSILDRCVSAHGGEITGDDVAACVGILQSDGALQLLEAVLQGDGGQAIAQLNEIYAAGRELGSVLDQLLSLIRDILLVKMAKGDVSGLISPSFTLGQLKNVGDHVTSSRLVAYANLLTQSASRLPRAPSKKIEAELLLIRLCQLGSDSFDSLTGRVEELEHKMQQGVFVKEKPQGAKEPEKSQMAEKTTSSTEIAESKSKKAVPVIKEPDSESKAKWTKLLTALKDKINRGTYTCMSLSGKGFFEENVLKIVAEDEITASLIMQEETRRLIAETAQSLFDQNYIIKATCEVELVDNDEIQRLVSRVKNAGIELKEMR